MKPHLQCAEQQLSRSNLTKYCACHAERLAYLVLITYETSFTMRGATAVTIQPHQILRLSRRKTHILSLHHLCNLIYNARSNCCHDPTSPNTAPVTQNCIAKFLTKSLKRDETSFPMRGRSENDPTMIREWSENDPTMKTQTATRLASQVTFRAPQDHFLWKIQRFEPNLTFKHSPSAAPATKSNTWPSPNTAPTTKSNTWTSPNTAPTTKSNTWTSPSTAPATKSDTHSSSSWHMKPHLQCAEQPMSPSKLTKYCACHAKWPLNVWQKFAENRWNVISNAGAIREWSEHDPRMIRPWSDHDPTMKTQTATRLASEVTFRGPQEHFLLWTGWILHSMFLIWNGLWFRRLGFFLLIGLPLVVSWGHFCVAGSTGGTKSFLMMLLGLMLLLMSCLVCINSRGRLLPCGLPFFSPVTFLSRAISVGCCGVFVAFGCHVMPKLSID